MSLLTNYLQLSSPNPPFPQEGGEGRLNFVSRLGNQYCDVKSVHILYYTVCIVAVPMEPRQRVVGGPEKMAEKKSKISASASSSDESLNHPSLIHHASRGNAQSSSSSSCCCSHCLYLSLPVSLTISLCLPPPDDRARNGSRI